MQKMDRQIVMQTVSCIINQHLMNYYLENKRTTIEDRFEYCKL